MKFLIVTGLSGAGKSTALKVLENLGFFCVDNLPAVLLTKFADLCFQGNPEFSRVAVGIDARGREFFSELEGALNYMTQSNYEYEVLFLYCGRDELVNRYNFTRHVHPLAQEGNLLECIEKEEEIMAPLRKYATYLLDTTKMTPKGVKMTLERLYKVSTGQDIKVYLSSFGYKRGVPLDADFMFDTRFLPNPYHVPELRLHSGLEDCVKEFLNGFEVYRKSVDMLYEQLSMIIPLYANSGKPEMFFAVGCTGGFHRSVAVAEELARRLREDGVEVVCEHRDLELEGEKWKNHSQL